MTKAKRLLQEIKMLRRKIYKNEKVLKQIQSECPHNFPDYAKKKKTRKVFWVTCAKCGYCRIESRFAAIK